MNLQHKQKLQLKIAVEKLWIKVETNINVTHLTLTV